MQTLPRRSFLSEYHKVSRYTRKFNSIYAHKKSLDFTLRIFTKIITAQQHCVQICYTDFHQNWTIKVDSTDRNLFAPLCKAWIVISTQQIVDDISCTECYSYRTKNVENVVKFILRSNVKYDFHCRFSLSSQLLNGIT
jgi:hypothetical protein